MGQGGRSAKLTNHLYVVLRLRRSIVITPLTQYAFIARAETQTLSPLPLHRILYFRYRSLENVPESP